MGPTMKSTLQMCMHGILRNFENATEGREVLDEFSE